uniref:Uncharacterized protein n=1 Tax=viral metagenome TaxID=1070528 RepID=A0A6M3Y166_9ZZZZ
MRYIKEDFEGRRVEYRHDEPGGAVLEIEGPGGKFTSIGQPALYLVVRVIQDYLDGIRKDSRAPDGSTPEEVLDGHLAILRDRQCGGIHPDVTVDRDFVLNLIKEIYRIRTELGVARNKLAGAQDMMMGIVDYIKDYR